MRNVFASGSMGVVCTGVAVAGDTFAVWDAVLALSGGSAILSSSAGHSNSLTHWSSQSPPDLRLHPQAC